MRTEDFELLYDLEENFWWFVAMRRITDAIAATELGKPRIRILDAGCGTGYNLGHYQSRWNHDVYGLDVTSAALQGVRKRGFQKIIQASVTDIPFHTESFDLVFSFDVLQQLTRDGADAGIREMHRVLKPGGFLFVRVAAFEWLRSSHDEELHTLHRFNRHELADRLVRAGLKVHRSSYANSFLFPAVVLRRSLKYLGIGRGTDVKPLPAGLGWIDPVFRRILSSEAAVFERGGRLPFGLSVIAYAEKRNVGTT